MTQGDIISFWRHVASEVHTAVKDCRSCVKQRFEMKPDRTLYMFPAAGPLEFVAINIVGLLSKTRSEADTLFL